MFRNIFLPQMFFIRSSINVIYGMTKNILLFSMQLIFVKSHFLIRLRYERAKYINIHSLKLLKFVFVIGFSHSILFSCVFILICKILPPIYFMEWTARSPFWLQLIPKIFCFRFLLEILYKSTQYTFLMYVKCSVRNVYSHVCVFLMYEKCRNLLRLLLFKILVAQELTATKHLYANMIRVIFY